MMELSIKNLKDVNSSDVLALSVHDDQLPFVETTESLLSGRTEEKHLYVFVFGEEVVGLCVVETGCSEKYEFARKADLHLEIFLIDKRFQGRGLGRQSCLLLRSYLRENFIDHDTVVLTVNCRNQGAYNCYVSSGFTDTGQLYHGGSAGPQHVMRLRLHP